MSWLMRGWDATKTNKSGTLGASVPVGVTGDAAHVMDGFKPSTPYAIDVTTDGTGQAVALATGVKLGAGRVLVTNTGTTGLGIRVAFGTSSVNAVANLTIDTGAATTGIPMEPVVDSPSGQNIWGVPALATYIAVANDTNAEAPTVSIVQGV